eukprot:6069020-Alexandrium_andersonii.AAC.1
MTRVERLERARTTNGARSRMLKNCPLPGRPTAAPRTPHSPSHPPTVATATVPPLRAVQQIQ